MRTLYIHGLDSYPSQERLSILKEYNLDPIALHLNYREKLGIYETLKDTIIRKNVKFIVGSSLGGYLGFLLSADMGIPCLLFNPAMNYKGKVFYSTMPEIKELNNSCRFIVLGAKDKSIDPQETKKLLAKYQHKGSESRIITCEWLDHEIDLTTFDGMLNWSLGGLRIRGCANVPD